MQDKYAINQFEQSVLNEGFLKAIQTTIEEDDGYNELEDLLEEGADIAFASS